ncbi:hypothetical protein [Streptomyces sp. NPDC005568]
MDQEQILARITAMVDDERRLRDALASGQIDSADVDVCVLPDG